MRCERYGATLACVLAAACATDEDGNGSELGGAGSSPSGAGAGGRSTAGRGSTGGASTAGGAGATAGGAGATAGSTAGGAAGSGGIGSTGGAAGSGGSSSRGGTAGATGSGGGGAAEGGGTGGLGASLCPAGADTMVLDLSDKAPSAPIAGMPPAGYPGSFNLEGPVWIGGALYASEIAGGTSPNAARILRYVPGGTPTVFLADAGTNGLAVDGDGNLVGARQTDGTISVFDIDAPTSTPTVLIGTYQGTRYNSPNDLALSSTGHLYFTDPDWQAPQPPPQGAGGERAYHLPPGGTVAPIPSTPSKPNGITLSLDEQTLYVTGQDGLVQYPVLADGSVGSASPVAGFSGGGDGMGMDCAGNLFVTNGTRVVVYDRNGAKYPAEIDVGASVTNVAFGGPGRTTMFVTSLSPAALRQIAMNIPGLPY